MERIGLVGCGARKLGRPAPAQRLYTGQLFRLAAAYARETCTRWFVLSALHGLVEPERVLLPYNLRLDALPRTQQVLWAQRVVADLDRQGFNTPGTAWLVLAGKLYRRDIVQQLHGPVSVPLASLGIGQQIAWLSRNRVAIRGAERYG